MNLKNQIWKIFNDLWEENTTLEAIAIHICYLFTCSFAFYFFILFVNLMGKDYVIIKESALYQMSTLVSWSNFFINIFTILIIFEVSSYIAKAYWDYRRDNL